MGFKRGIEEGKIVKNRFDYSYIILFDTFTCSIFFAILGATLSYFWIITIPFYTVLACCYKTADIKYDAEADADTDAYADADADADANANANAKNSK